jgi:GT2 family glycosyltransferase
MGVAVSVVIPVFNDAEGLERALAALVRQSLPAARYEVVVADNGSYDRTPAVAAGYAEDHPGLVRWLDAGEVRGSYAARNHGARYTTGGVLAFTDADCVPDPSWLAEALAALASTGAAAVAGRIEMTFRGATPNAVEYFDAARKLNQRLYVEQYGFGATANLLVRREAFEALGGFRAELRSGGDYEFGRRLTESGAGLAYADEAVVRHPARSTVGGVLRKSRRVAEGQRALARLGVLEHGRLTLRSLVPTRRCPPLAGYATRVRHRVGYLVLANAVKYLNAWVRVR